MPFPPDDGYHFTAACGYRELGMLGEAEAELEQITPGFRGAPEVLTVRLAIFQEAGRWAAMQLAARKLAELFPGDPQWLIARAYATRRAESVEMARLILIEALERHPLIALIHYNMACYDCVLGDLPSAQRYLLRALKLEPALRAVALEDADLEPLRSWLLIV